MNAPYSRALSRQYPGLFVILLDQSVSMTETYTGSAQSKADLVTMHVNRIIQNMISFAPIDEFTGRRKNYAYLSVLGYNHEVYPLLTNTTTPVDIPWLDEHARGRVPVRHVKRYVAGNVVDTLTEKVRYWIEPKAEGNTEMARAFREAEVVIRRWLNSQPEIISDELGSQRPRMECFPPVLINITDAINNGDEDPGEVADRIRQISTHNGNVLICNCHFTHNQSEPCNFPHDISQVEHLSRSAPAKRMFQMSSPIPEALREKAERAMRMPIVTGARCFVYNADPDVLLKFLRWSTLPMQERGGHH